MSTFPLLPPPGPDGREALEFDLGVLAYPPVAAGGYWRIRWTEDGRRKDTTASNRQEAIDKASGIVERLSAGVPTARGRAKGVALIEHYLDPVRRPARGRRWSERHREEQTAYCTRFVCPVIDEVDMSRLTRAHFQRILDAAATASVADHLRRCLSAMVRAGLDEGLLLARQDVLRGVHWAGGDQNDPEGFEETGRFVEEAEIPTTVGVHDLAKAAAARSGVWWRELQILLVAYSGVRWGEMVGLTSDRVDLDRRRILIDRQVVEGRHGLRLGPPKSRRRRTTMYPSRTPGGVDLGALVAQRIAEVERCPEASTPSGLLFPSPQGYWARRSNFARNLFHPAAAVAGWPRVASGRFCWTFHSLRHVFATWALSQPGARLEDVSKLLGHSTVRVTQDLYVSPDGDLYERFYRATR
ncbi:MAG: tyrosine-type recombinase/integrase [Actinobacteria bacterium]|nr:tyrosine-type recombinase/integrase [Actinomycetota bacterium]